MHVIIFATRAGALALTAALAACAIAPVGPNYSVPATALVNKPGAGAAFAQASAAAAAGTSAPFADAPLPAHWWRLYQDPRLDALIEKALAHNTDLRQALANLEKSQAAEVEVGGQKKPTLSVEGGPAFGHVSGISLLAENYSPPSTWEYGAGASLSYQLDLFGRIQRGIEAASDNTEAAQAALDLVRVNVAAGTARAYADACATGLRIASAERSTELQQQALDISVRLQQAGRVGITDAARARSQLQGLKAAIPPLEARRQAALYRLATLTGDLPQDFARDVATCAVPPQVVGTIPVGDGAALLRRRPDIRQAERQLAAATATIGVATADLYPRISLTGFYGGAAADINALTTNSGLIWGLGPKISWTFPNQALPRARIRQAKSGEAAALANFDSVVLQALKETETSLAAYGAELDRRQSLAEAQDRAQQAFDLAHDQFLAGSLSNLELLTTEQSLVAADAAVAASDAAVVQDQIAVFKALGGGWRGPKGAGRS